MSTAQKTPWMECPKCGNDNVDMDVYDLDSETGTMRVISTCMTKACSFCWTEIYQFVQCRDEGNFKVLDESGNPIG